MKRTIVNQWPNEGFQEYHESHYEKVTPEETEKRTLSSWYESKLRLYPSGKTVISQIYHTVLQFSIQEYSCGRTMTDEQQIRYGEYCLGQYINPFTLA